VFITIHDCNVKWFGHYYGNRISILIKKKGRGIKPTLGQYETGHIIQIVVTYIKERVYLSIVFGFIHTEFLTGVKYINHH